jgi:hypothetical membrane protein
MIVYWYVSPKNEFIDLGNIKISKNHNIESVTFQIYFIKNYSIIINTLIVNQFRMNFKFLFQILYKKSNDENHRSDSTNI